MHEISTLENGLRVVSENIAGTQALTVLCLAGAGSRYEELSNSGVAHFLEHIFFKGGKKYENTQAVSAAIDEVGGEFNAFTGKEYAGYYVKVASKSRDRAFDVLSDMLLYPSFTQEDVDKERQVIVQELEMYQDTPMYQVEWEWERQMFGDCPLGRDQIGTRKFLDNASREDLLDFRSKLYTPDNIVISVAGDITHADAVELVKKYFAFPEGQKSLEYVPYESPAERKRVNVVEKKSAQAHFLLGVDGVDSFDENKAAAKVLASVLGGNMSSRMFLNVREKLGLCYSIRTSSDSFLDTGLFSTYAGVAPERFFEAIGAIKAEYEKILNEKITAEELQKTKNYINGKMVLGLEDSETVAHMMASQLLLKGEIKTAEELQAEVEKVSSEEVAEMAQRLLGEKLHLTVIGDFAGKEGEIEGLLG